MSSQTPHSQQLQTILDQIEKFGFKFFGYGENNEPLVIAPNGQVIPIKIAYDFVKQQILKSEESTSGNLESLPNAIPQSIDFKTPDTALEKSPENESTIEKQQESSKNIQVSNSQVASGANDTPVHATEELKMPLPFDEGFKIKSFNPQSIKEAEEFVEKHKSGSSGSTKTWLAAQFKKFMDEYNLKAPKKTA